MTESYFFFIANWIKNVCYIHFKYESADSITVMWIRYFVWNFAKKKLSCASSSHSLIHVYIIKYKSLWYENKKVKKKTKRTRLIDSCTLICSNIQTHFRLLTQINGDEKKKRNSTKTFLPKHQTNRLKAKQNN